MSTAMRTTTYNGDPNLKRENVPIRWTKGRLEEWEKCKNDPIYFAEKYIKIVHPDDGLIPITMYEYQKEIVNNVTNHRRTAVCTSRQAGKTTTACCIILHFAIFNPYKMTALLANKLDGAQEILERIQTAYKALPLWLQQGVGEFNKRSIRLENGSVIIAAATKGDSIRGKSIALLYIDEAAFVEGWEQFFAAVYPTISSGKTTKVLFTSTPNGLNHFYKTCEGAKNGLNGYKYVEVPWTKVPGRDEQWKAETLAALDFDQEKFEQEYNCGFIGSSGTLISGSKLKSLVYKKPIIETPGLKMYETPIVGKSYVCSVDVSRGKGLDHSAFSIIDVTQLPYKQVCVFRDNTVSPMEYAEIINRTCRSYNEAMTLVEINDIGGQVADLLHFEFEYENLLYTENAGRSGKRIATGFGGKSTDLGIRTTSPVKATGCSILKLLIEQDQLIVNDFETIAELSTFSRKRNSYEAEPGAHDDIVMGLVLFAWLSDQQYFKNLTDIYTMRELREKSEAQIYEELTPFGFIENGIGKEEDPIFEDVDEVNEFLADEDNAYQGWQPW